MSEVLINVRVTVDDDVNAKFNDKRKRHGGQSMTAAERVINCVSDALRHELAFTRVELEELATVTPIDATDRRIVTSSNVAIE